VSEIFRQEVDGKVALNVGAQERVVVPGSTVKPRAPSTEPLDKAQAEPTPRKGG